MQRVIVTAILVGGIAPLSSCISVDKETLGEVNKLTETVDELGGRVKEISDEWREEVRDICDDGLRKADEAQTSIAEACEGIVEAERKRKCKDFNRRQRELLERIRQRCEENR
jgi:vacuolar-type H+-ATPase subunit E/Vma4